MSSFDVEDVLSQLNINEKISLLAGSDFWHTVEIPRLNIPSVRVSDGPNGVRGTKFFNSIPAACFPCGTGIASSWNKQLIREAGELMGEEASHKSIHVILGPTTNMQRGPLGGRGFESFSEDPYLAGMASASVVKGIQNKKVGATIKHYAGNDLENERMSSDSIITDRALREIYLEPFRLAVKYADPLCFMSGYNKINGEHVSQSEKFLKKILREEWGWDGLVMSDWYGTYTTDTAIRNGLDLEMPGPTRFRNPDSVRHMVESRELHIDHIDARVRNVLKLVKFALDSGIPFKGPESDANNTADTRAKLRSIADETVVLLKNEGVLPLKKDESVAVIGPNAKLAGVSGGGSAALNSYYKTTVYGSVKDKLGKDPKYTVGAYSHKSLPTLISHIKNPKTGAVGYNMKIYNKEPGFKGDRDQVDEIDSDNASLFFPDYQNEKLTSNIYHIDIHGELEVDETADYDFSLTVYGTAQLFIDGKLVVDNKTKQEKGYAFFNMGSTEVINTIRLEKGKKYDVKVEMGSGPTFTVGTDDAIDFGGGALAIGFAKVIDDDAEIAHAVEIAKSVDKVVLSVGLDQEWESEGYDRTNMELPRRTNDLVAAVLAANPNTVVVNQSGTPVEMPWLQDAKALVHAWYGGSEAGNAIADVLFGDVNPSGKLSLSFPFKNIDNPAYLNFKTERGRVLYGEDIFIGYRYYEKLQKKVAFPFGYGLSYTDYAYSNLKVSIDESGDKIKASVDVKNVGKVDGQEIVQLYTSHKDSATIKPIKELKGFEKVSVKAGETVTANFELDLKDSLSFFDEYFGKWSLEAGSYEILVGKSSDDIELIEEFKIKNSKLWSGI